MSESIQSIFQEFNNLAKPEPFWKGYTKTIIYDAGITGFKTVVYGIAQ